ncbi:MAG: prepilin-type N-terminal cleavage/methylation domain-containing protein [Candidatus Babeliales bacterium]
MKQGFTLIETLISLAISGMIASALFIFFMQIQRLDRSLQQRVSIDYQVGIVKEQLEKDITAAFMPLELQKDEKKEKKEADGKEKKENRFFVYKQAQEVMQEITCITTHRNQVVVPQKEMRPLLTRVTYTLEPHENKKELFRLTRTQEEWDRGPKKKKEEEPKKQRVILAPYVQKIAFQCIYEQEAEKKESDQKDKKEEKKEPVYKTVSDWNADTSLKNKRPLLPTWITGTITITDAQEQRTQTVTVCWPLYAAHAVPKAGKKPDKPTEQPAPAKASPTAAVPPKAEAITPPSKDSQTRGQLTLAVDSGMIPKA